MSHRGHLRRLIGQQVTEPDPRKPTTDTAGCFASGHATAAPPSSVMNSCRLMST